MSKFKLNSVDEKVLPPTSKVSAVFFLGIKDNQILSIRNERGWDIPGGHVEEGEALLEALRRETLEEASAKFMKVKPFLYLSSDDYDKVMLFYFTNDFVLEEFKPHEDSFERAVLSIEDFLSKYYGDKEMMRRIFKIAQNNSKSWLWKYP